MFNINIKEMKKIAYISVAATIVSCQKPDNKSISDNQNIPVQKLAVGTMANDCPCVQEYTELGEGYKMCCGKGLDCLPCVLIYGSVKPAEEVINQIDNLIKNKYPKQVAAFFSNSENYAALLPALTKDKEFLSKLVSGQYIISEKVCNNARNNGVYIASSSKTTGNKGDFGLRYKIDTKKQLL